MGFRQTPGCCLGDTTEREALWLHFLFQTTHILVLGWKDRPVLGVMEQWEKQGLWRQTECQIGGGRFCLWDLQGHLRLPGWDGDGVDPVGQPLSGAGQEEGDICGQTSRPRWEMVEESKEGLRGLEVMALFLFLIRRPGRTQRCPPGRMRGLGLPFAP